MASDVGHRLVTPQATNTGMDVSDLNKYRPNLIGDFESKLMEACRQKGKLLDQS